MSATRTFKRHGKEIRMRKVELLRAEYNDFVWPSMILPTKEVAQLETLIAVKTKLKAVGEPLPMDAEARAAEADGHFRFVNYRASNDVTLLLEEDEHKWLKARLKDFLPHMTGYAAEAFHELLQKVDQAEKVEVQATTEPKLKAMGE